MRIKGWTSISSRLPAKRVRVVIRMEIWRHGKKEFIDEVEGEYEFMNTINNEPYFKTKYEDIDGCYAQPTHWKPIKK